MDDDANASLKTIKAHLPTLDEVRAAKNKLADLLAGVAGVTGIGIGLNDAIVVLLNTADPGLLEMIPFQFDGITVTTQVIGEVRAESYGADLGLYINERAPAPHSRACGYKEHSHGSACHSNCPTCAGKNPVDWGKPTEVPSRFVYGDYEIGPR